MINWIIKIFAFVTVVALALGLAAEFTALAGNVSSLSSKPTSTSERPMSILTRRATSKKASKKPLVREAYKWGSDFPQRPGGIFHGASYHVLTSIGFTAMMGHQVLRALSPGSLNIIFKFFPGLQGPWGLSGSGAIMIYVSMQIMSYSIGTMHVVAAIMLFFAGCLNLCGGFVEPIASCDGGDPFGGGAGAYPPGGMDDGYPDQMGGGGAPIDASDAPDPYDGSDPSAPGLAMDTGDGVGASAPPPGMIDKEVKTFGGRPPGMTPALGYGQNNAETNPAMLAATSGGQGATGNPGEVVFDPSSGMWTTVPGAQPQVQQPAPAMLPGAMPGVPMGYDMLGRPIMAPGAMSMGMPAAVPGMYPGWPGLMPPQPAVISDEASAKSGKKQAKREARKEFKKLRREEREAEREDEEQEERRREKEARKRQKEYERQVRREEKRQQNLARAEAMDDAQQRTAVEIAEEDARRRQYQDAMSDRRNQAMADAQREAYEYQREDHQRNMQARQEQEQYMMARETAEQDAMQRETADEAEYKRQMQAQALSAAQRAAVMGDPLRPPMSGRGSYASRATSARHRQRSPSPAYQEPESDAYSQQGPMPGYGQYARSQRSAPQTQQYSQRSMPQMQQYTPSQKSAPQAGQYSHRSAPRASQYTQSDMPMTEQYSQRGVPPPLAYPGQRSIAPSTVGGASRYPGQQDPPARGYPRQPPPSLQEDDQYYPYDDDDDAMTEIRSVMTETSSQRDLLKRRMMEERERVLAQQEAQKQQEYLRPEDPYSAEDGFSDILADYRSGRSGRSGGSSSRRRQGW